MHSRSHTLSSVSHNYESRKRALFCFPVPENRDKERVYESTVITLGLDDRRSLSLLFTEGIEGTWYKDAVLIISLRVLRGQHVKVQHGLRRII